MLETILKLYVMAMTVDVRSPLPHLFGPPGCGKSSVVEELAELVGCNLHIINVSRISPLELEGVQMPTTSESGQHLKLLHATWWTQLKDGDIILLDEFLRGFPEVYNGLLDILTSRQVGGLKLPKVFIIAASNSTVAYDKALEDRLMHITVPDPRKRKSVRKQMAKRLVDTLGLDPGMADSTEMQSLLDNEVLPMYEMLDSLKGTSAPSISRGSSLRNLIGQAQLRHIQSGWLKELLIWNNRHAIQQGHLQYVLLLDGKVKEKEAQTYANKAPALQGDPGLTAIQAQNLELNLQLIEMERIRQERGTTEDDDDVTPFADDLPF